MSTTTLSPSALYCAYLRKSRKDAELEALGQGETLARHAKALNDLAERLGIAIAHTYREVVSGDTIAERPQMRRLLEAVNAGAWAGVLVMDADRLGRGDSIDQGVIMQSFLYSSTLIITPDKIYDPTDDSDSEFFEIKLFFARREYNMIKKRMQRGRLASAMAGSWQSPRAPYGYERCQLPSRKWSLAPVPEQAEIVRSVFRWYADGDAGTSTIARRLNEMGLTTSSGGRWTSSSLTGMLTNPVYIGKVQWNKRVSTVHIEDGRRVKSRPLSEHPVLAEGLHDGIVDPALFERVQAMFAGHAKRPNNVNRPTTNPLAGLVVCGQCGMHMQAKNTPGRRGDFLCCQTQDCPTCSTYIFVVEEAVLGALGEWLGEFEVVEDPLSKNRDRADCAQNGVESDRDGIFCDQPGGQAGMIDEETLADSSGIPRGGADTDSDGKTPPVVSGRRPGGQDVMIEARTLADSSGIPRGGADAADGKTSAVSGRRPGGQAGMIEARTLAEPDPDAQARAAARAQLKEHLRTLESQSDRLYDLLEQGIYTVQVYRQRREELDARIKDAQDGLAALDAAPHADPRRLLVPQLRTVLEGYQAAPTPADKNRLLRTVIDHITYHKTQRCYRNNKLTDHLNLEIIPRVVED